MDPITGAALIAGAGSLASGGLNFLGQHRSNKANIASAREAMGFQERMSNTAYQRTMEDMRQAGLNPMLAAMKGGASTPGGATSISQNEFQGAVSSAMEFRRANAEIQNLREITDRTKTEAALNKTLEKAAVNDMKLKTLSTASQVSLNNASQNNLDSQLLLNIANAKNAASQNKLLESDVVGRSLEADIDATKYGEVLRYLSRALPFVGRKR